MKRFLELLRSITKYPAVIFSGIIVSLLVVSAIVVVFTIPYDEAIDRWRGGEEQWGRNPRTVPPVWVNWFRKDKLVETMEFSTGDGVVTAEEEVTKGGTRITTYTFPIDFQYNTFPQDLVLYFTATYESKQPFVTVSWFTPDEREIKVDNFAVSATHTYPISQNTDLKKKFNGTSPEIGLFLDPETEQQVPMRGDYQLVLEVINFEEDSTVDIDLVVLGQVFGWAGTDHLRRDLTLPILWGIPIALAFGLLAAIGTSVLTMIIAASGAWYGGVVDGLIQRITEINLVLPFLSILIMVGTFYSRTIWTILGVTVLLSIFTGSIKSYRAIFMQVKESTYIEAAQAYGASNGRIIFRYLIPRIIPLLIPGLLSAVPAFVFLEASLALLGIGDPVLPTWGKTINDARINGALYRGWYYWILEPAALLMITGLGFALLGFTLDRIFNPRLRGL